MQVEHVQESFETARLGMPRSKARRKETRHQPVLMPRPKSMMRPVEQEPVDEAKVEVKREMAQHTESVEDPLEQDEVTHAPMLSETPALHPDLAPVPRAIIAMTQAGFVVKEAQWCSQRANRLIIDLA